MHLLLPKLLTPRLAAALLHGEELGLGVSLSRHFDFCGAKPHPWHPSMPIR
jgi:hypothetical protein